MIKTIITILAAMLMAMPATAQSKAATSPTFCADIEDIARMIMEARQRNASMSRVMKIMQETLPDSIALTELMVAGAYEKPAYSSPEYQKREIDDFANYWAARCYEMQRKKR